MVTTDAEQERYFTLSEVARLLEVSDQSVRRWIKAGELKAFKPGKDYRIARSDLQTFLDKSRAAIQGKVRAPRLFDDEPDQEQRRLIKVHAIRITEDGFEFLDESGQVVTSEQRAPDFQVSGAVGETQRLAAPLEMAIPSAVA